MLICIKGGEILRGTTYFVAANEIMDEKEITHSSVYVLLCEEKISNDIYNIVTLSEASP